MEWAARRFARNVLLTHLLLLVIVLGVLFVAAKRLHHAARLQAIEQAKQTQELLATQTAAGVRGYYDALTSVMDLVRPILADGGPGAGPGGGPTTRPDAPPRANGLLRPDRMGGPRFSAGEPPKPPTDSVRAKIRDRMGEANSPIRKLGNAIWASVKDRVSVLFIVNGSDRFSVSAVVGDDDPTLEPAELVDHARSWLESLNGPSVSHYMKFNESAGGHLVVLPIKGPSRMAMIAAVPIRHVNAAIFRAINTAEDTGAMLVDDQATILIAWDDKLVGTNVTRDMPDPRTRELAEEVMRTGQATTRVFDRSQVVNGVQLKPAMVSIQPIDVLGQRWWMVVSSNLSRVDELVSPIFRDAMLWASAIVAAVTALLVSTATKMIRNRVRVERMRTELLSKEINQAREIQLNWLPKQPCDFGKLDICAINKPASHVSGDFYDWFSLPDGRVVVTIGDVTGHGMAAAFLMSTTQLLVRSNMLRFSDPGQCMTEVNRQLCIQSFHGQFVTILICVIDLDREQLTLCNGGHHNPLLLTDRGVDKMNVEPDFLLGVVEGHQYASQQLPLKTGSGLVLYTDGVIEAVNSTNEQFTDERLMLAVDGNSGDPARVIDRVMKSLDSFRGPMDLADDATMVTVAWSKLGSQTGGQRPGGVLSTVGS